MFDISIITKIEKKLQTIPEIHQVAVVLEELIPKAPPFHVDDLLPEISHSNEHSDVYPKNEIINLLPPGQSNLTDDPVRSAFSYGGPLKVKPDEPQTLQEVLQRALHISKNNGIIYIKADGSECFESYAELLDAAQRILTGLRSLGLKPKDHVLFQCKDNQNFINAFWACILGGFLPAPIGVGEVYTEMNAVVSKLYNVWNLLNQPVILTDDDLEQPLKGLRELWKTGELRIQSVKTLLNHLPDTEWYPCRPNDLALNLLTSGSTGIPKCVQHPHQTILARSIANSQANSFTKEDVSLNWMPLDHVGGLVMFHIRDVYVGCRQIIAKIESFIANPIRWLDWVDQYKATITWAPNFAFTRLINNSEKIRSGHWDLSSLRYILNGGEAVVAKVAHDFLKLLEPYGLPSTSMVPSYGMSEISSGVVESRLFTRDDETSGIQIIDKGSLNGILQPVELGSLGSVVFTEVGAPLPGIYIRVVDDKNKITSEDQIGRVQVTGPTIMAGYYNNPEANQEAFVGDGWFNTGDLGFLHQGRLIITGREKDIIIINGVNYYNYEIEAVVEEILGVETNFAAACAVNDNDGVDQLAIFFVPTDPTMVTKIHLVQEIRRRVIEKVRITPKIILPLNKESFFKTANGKIQRVQLKKAFENGQFNSISKQLDIALENENTLPDMVYQNEWIESKVDAVPQNEIGNRLIFADRSGLAEAFVKQSGAGDSILVRPGDCFTKIDNCHYLINPHRQTDYVQLLQSMEDLPIHQILHMWNYDRFDKITGLKELKSVQYLGSFSLVFLAQALVKQKYALLQLVVITSNLQRVFDESEIDYEKAPLIGIIKTISNEFKTIQCKHIDLVPGIPEENAQFIAKEMGISDSEICSAYREGKRYISKLKKVDLATQSNNPIPIRAGGFYIITGGLGGVGSIVAKYLLQFYQAKVLIFGRTRLAETNQQQASPVVGKLKTFRELRDMERFGGMIDYQAVNITDLAGLIKIVEEMEATWGASLDGIIHFAGIIQECLLADQTIDQLEEMYKSKVYGTWVLHQLIKDRTDCLFISASSAWTLAGGMTVGAYCSANNFLETFSQYQRHVAHVKSYCFSWSLWDEIGMGKGLVIKEQLNDRGYASIYEKQGFNYFLMGLKCNRPLLYLGLDETKKELRKFTGDGGPQKLVLKVFFTSTVKDFPVAQLQLSMEKLADAGPVVSPLDKVFFQLNEIPLTETGKIDRESLRRWNDDKAASPKYVAPRSPVETQLIEICKRVLEIPKISVLDNISSLGADSIKMMLLISAIKEIFGLDIQPSEIYKEQIIEKIAKNIEFATKTPGSTPVKPISRYPRGNVVAMSSAQKRQWFLYKLQPESPYYNNTIIFRLSGKVDTSILQKSLQWMINRHETLRTTFNQIQSPAQIVHPPFQPEIVVIDIKQFPEEVQREQVIQFIQKESMQPFNLITGPLFRTTLLRLNDHQSILIFSIHHIVFDGWSARPLFKELAESYGAYIQGETPEMEDLPIQYADFSLWQQEWFLDAGFQKQLKYWKDQLSGELPTLNIPTDLSRPPIQSHQGKIQEIMLSFELTQKLKNMSRATENTLYMTLLSGFFALLYRYTGQDEMIIGSLIANRNRAELINLIGFFANTVALRLIIPSNADFLRLLKDVRELTLAVQNNQDVPFDMVLEQLQIQRNLSYHPIFQVLFVLQNISSETVQMGDITADLEIFYNDTAKFDLSVQIFETPAGLRIIIEYNTDIFYDVSISRLLGHYRVLLGGAVQNYQSRLSELPILTVQEFRQIIYEWNDTTADFPKEKCLQQFFEIQVDHTPNACAVIYGQQKISYRELNEKANQLARVLRDKGITSNQIVGLLINRSFEMIIGIMAVLKAGGAYLPVSPEFPPERIREILEDSTTGVLLTQGSLADGISFQGMVLDLSDNHLYQGDSSNLEIIYRPSDLAYVIYTSGSTGKSKGVMIEHCAVVNRLNWSQRKYPINENDIILQKTPYTFDVSVWELLWWSLQGAILCFLAQGGEKDPAVIIETVEKNKVSIMHFVPSMLNAFLDYIESNTNEIKRLSTLRRVFSSGEALNIIQMQKFDRLLYQTNHTSLHNLYGPTEAAIEVSYFDCFENVQKKLDNVPIGKPIDNIQLLILDKNDNIQPIGAPGELYITGIGLARGYLNRPDLTIERFVTHPYIPGAKMYKTGDIARWLPDGNIEYMGRMDHQVKIRGYRIELGEIELLLLTHILIKEALVLDQTDENNQKYLCAYYTSEHELTVIELRECLKKKLPDYMIPSYFIHLEKIPLTANGKVDRKALPHPKGAIHLGTEYVTPRNSVEEKLVQAWLAVLGVNKVGIHDNFFNLGGDSIKAIQVLGWLNEHGLQLELNDIFQYPTIEEMNKFVKQINLGTDLLGNNQNITKDKYTSSIDHEDLQRLFKN